MRANRPENRTEDRRVGPTTSTGRGNEARTARSPPEGRTLLRVLLVVQLIGARPSSVRGGQIQVDVDVPREAKVGSSVELGCEWRLLGGNGLYSVKWYKDDHEFFRYVPDDDPAIQTFPRPGVDLDKKRSSEKTIKLRQVDLASSGQYKCEVSAEAPSFATTYRKANLTVIAPPERGPEITGLSSSYAIGENVTANCTARPSVPEATLRWIVNGQSVPEEKVIRYPSVREVGSAKSASRLGLRVEAEPKSSEESNGASTIRIKCVAEVGSSVLEEESRVPMVRLDNQRLSADVDSIAATDALRPSSPLVALVAVIAVVAVALFGQVDPLVLVPSSMVT